MHAIDRLVDAWTNGEEGSLPSICAEVRVDGAVAYRVHRGVARRSPERLIAPDQTYDLASVTKALAAATVAATALERGEIELHAPAARWRPELDPRITVAHLLTHSSGYPAWRPLYTEAIRAWGTATTREALLRSAWATPLEAEPGTRHSYSDLGMLALLGVLEAATEQRFGDLFRDRVQLPAEVEDLRWGWPGAAATELCPVRGILVEGTVHDLNCAALGGISTHAGLFGTAAAVAALADRLRTAVADPARWANLPGRSLRTLWGLRGAGTHRGGWDAISPGYSSTGHFFPADTVGHLGYTGTSVWVAPSRRTTVALLTNRVHPVDDKATIRSFRPLFHDAVARTLGWAA